MLKLRKKYVKMIYRIFLLCITSILALFLFRIITRSEKTPMSVGQMLLTAEEYIFGSILDRDGEVIVSGSRKGKLNWNSEEVKLAFDPIFGMNIEKNLLSRTTLLGNCPWIFGTEDSRWEFTDLLNPAKKRIGGSVKLTLDTDLQKYIRNLMEEKGYTNAYAVVSNYSTGEILGATGGIFQIKLHPGSTVKPILAAAVLSLYPELSDYTYNCVANNHIFQTGNGLLEIQCAGNIYHGKVSMEDALVYSCNGYFVSLMQQCDPEKISNQMAKWGFDTTVSYSQFMYWDHTFLNESTNETDYLMAAIGQANVSVTPAGMHFCTTGLLNHGVLEEPIWFAQKKVSPEAEWKEISSHEGTIFCEAEIADHVVKMMQQVTERGTGKSFYLPEFAAKTGTAQKADKEGNLSGLYTVWTTGGLTDKTTPYSVTVCLDDVTNVNSEDAGKIAQKILQYLVETEGGK